MDANDRSMKEESMIYDYLMPPHPSRLVFTTPGLPTVTLPVSPPLFGDILALVDQHGEASLSRLLDVLCYALVTDPSTDDLMCNYILSPPHPGRLVFTTPGLFRVTLPVDPALLGDILALVEQYGEATVVPRLHYGLRRALDSLQSAHGDEAPEHGGTYGQT